MTTDAERLRGLRARDREFQADDHQRALAIQAWFCCHQRPPRPQLTQAHHRACEAVGLNADAEVLNLRLLSHRRFAALQRRPGSAESLAAGTMSTDAVADGGAIMPPEAMLSAIEQNMLSYGALLQLAQVVRTDTRQPLRWPTVNDTGNQGRRIGESQPVAAANNPVLAAVSYELFKYTSDEILVPYELLSGVPVMLAESLGELLGTRIGRAASADFTNGTGVNGPNGLLKTATPFAAAAPGAIAWDDVEGLISAVDPAYRIGASFMFHDNIRLYLSRIKDGAGRRVWDERYDADGRPILKGWPCVVNQSMDSTIAAGKKTISFGSHSQYKVYQFDQIRIHRLIEQHRESDQDAFLAFMEMDGGLVDAGTPPVKYLQH